MNFEPKDLNYETIKQIFHDCMPIEGETKKYRSVIIQSVGRGFSKNTDKIYFDSDKLAENKLNIIYLLGQLYAVHRGDKSLKLSDILKKYNGYLWSKEKSASIFILSLGIGVGQFYSPDAAQLSCDVLKMIEPTLSPKDPLFPAWWEQVKSKWKEYIDIEMLFMKGNELYLAERYEETFKIFSILAKCGHLEAQYHLAGMYQRGKGTEKDYEEAIKWFKEAAEHGHMEAQYHLGSSYHYGIGTEKNLKEAIKWYKLAAEQGKENAQLSLAFMYKDGEGTEKDYEEAIKWFKEASKQGREEAQMMLSIIYDDAEADFVSAVMYDKGEFGAEKNYKEAFKLYKSAAEKGHKIAQNNLAAMYLYGKGTEENREEAIKWFTKAAEQGYENAQHMLDKILH